jgi:hypothetical protein
VARRPLTPAEGEAQRSEIARISTTPKQKRQQRNTDKSRKMPKSERPPARKESKSSEQANDPDEDKGRISM